MPWWLFGTGLLLTYVLQTAAVGALDLRAVDLFLAFALVLAFVAPSADARIAGTLIGFAQDLGSGQHDAPLGLFAFALGLAALLVTLLREWVNVRLWWARAVAAFLAGLLSQMIAMIYLRYFGIAAGGWWRDLGHCLATAALAAILATLLVQLPELLRRKPSRVTRYGGWRG